MYLMETFKLTINTSSCPQFYFNHHQKMLPIIFCSLYWRSPILAPVPLLQIFWLRLLQQVSWGIKPTLCHVTCLANRWQQTAQLSQSGSFIQRGNTDNQQSEIVTAALRLNSWRISALSLVTSPFSFLFVNKFGIAVRYLWFNVYIK